MTETNQPLEQNTTVEAKLDDIDSIISNVMAEEPGKPSEAPLDDLTASNTTEEPESKEQATEPTEAAAPAFEAPKHWSEEDRAVFEKLEGSARDLVLQLHKKTEAAHTRRSQELAEEKKKVEEITQTLEPYRAELRNAGLREADVVKQGIAAINWDYKLRTDPINTAKQLLQNYNIPLEQITNEYIDPDISALHNEIQQLKNAVQEEKTNKELQSRSKLQQEVDAFRQQTDENGNPKYPHFETLRNEMSGLLASGIASDLASAYTKALRTRDDLYDQDVQSRIQAELKKKEEARQAEIEKAKKAARHLTGNGPARRLPTKSDSLDDIIKNAMGGH